MTVLVGTVSLKSSVKEPQREALKALAADGKVILSERGTDKDFGRQSKKQKNVAE